MLLPVLLIRTGVQAPVVSGTTWTPTTRSGSARLTNWKENLGMGCPIRIAVAFFAGALLPTLVAGAEPVAAVVSTTLATGAEQIRQFAFDGKLDTFFVSKENLRTSDHFTLLFDHAVSARSVAVITGKADSKKTDSLEDGTLEVSSDGKTFVSLAKFAGGTVRKDLHGKRIQAVRIKPASGQDHPLAVREFTIASDPPVGIFKYPIEIDVDCADSPEMRDWASKAASLCERWYPRINDELKSEGYKPAHHVTMKITTTYDGVAAASGHEIVGATKFFKDHPDDLGAMIHETVHIVQNYHSRKNPGWLVEGVADFFRFFIFEPGKIGPIRARGARYDGSYRTTAAFLGYVTHRYRKSLVNELNAVMRQGKYSDAIFKELTGKTVEELDKEWRQTLKR
jgi:hypothetical protein